MVSGIRSVNSLMTIEKLRNLVNRFPGAKIYDEPTDFKAIRFYFGEHKIRISTRLLVEHIDNGMLISDDIARHVETLFKDELWRINQ